MYVIDSNYERTKMVEERINVLKLKTSMCKWLLHIQGKRMPSSEYHSIVKVIVLMGVNEAIEETNALLST